MTGLAIASGADSRQSSVDVIAAALALPFVERELKRWQDSGVWGNNSAAEAARRRHAERRRPLIARRDELLAVLLDTERHDAAKRKGVL
jgi:hypothetical protein